MTGPAYLTLDDLAARFGVSREWVRRRCRTGEFPHLRIGSAIRFTEAHVAQIEKAHEVTPDPERETGDPWGRKKRGKAS